MPNIRFKDVYDEASANTLLEQNKNSEYIDYLKSLQNSITDIGDRNRLSASIARLSTELSKENYTINKVRSLHGEEGVEKYNFLKAVESGTSLSGNTYWDKFKKQSDILGSELDEDGNITRRAESLSFAFDTEYDFNNFLEATGYNIKALQENGIVYGKMKGKPYISVDKGNREFINVIKGVNSIDDYHQNPDYLENINRALGVPLNRAIREVNIHNDSFSDKLYGIGSAVGKFFKSIIGPYGESHVLMTSFDEQGREIKKVYGDKVTNFDYDALGDNLLKEYKSAKSLLSDVETMEEERIQQVQRLGYLTYNQSKAMDYLNKTSDYDYYNKFIAEEFRRADIEIMNSHLGNFKVYSTIDGDYMQEVPYEDIQKIEDLIHNAISEGGNTNEGRRVSYETGILGTDAGLYITIAPKSDENKISDDKQNLQNTLPGRTFFIKGMLDNVTEDAINRRSEWRAYKEVQQMTNWNYDFYFEDGSKITNCDNYSGIYIDNYGQKREIDKGTMQNLINKEFAVQDAKSYLTALYKDAIVNNNTNNIEDDIKKLAKGISINVIDETSPNLLPNEYKRQVLELYTKLLKDIGIDITKNNK